MMSVDGALIVLGTLAAILVAFVLALQCRRTQRAKGSNESARQLSVRIQQLHTLREIGQRLASTLDLNQVLDAVCESALRIVPASDAHIFLYDEESGQFGHGVGVWADGHRGTVVAKPRPDGLSATVVRARHPIVINDAQNHPLFQSPQARQWNLKAIAGFPIIKANRAIAVLNVAFLHARRITPEEEQTLLVLADQAAIAIDNALLFEETKRRAEELSTLRSIGLATTSTLNLHEQLRLLYENVTQVLKADTFFVGLYDEARQELRVEYVVEEGWPLRPVTIPLDQAGLSAWVIRNQKPLRVADLAEASNLPAQPQHLTRPARSWLGVPLLLKDHVVGLLSVQSFRPNAFAVQDERFLTAVAQHVVLALDNARLFSESERRARELTLLNEISRAISASLDLGVIESRTVHALANQLGYRYVALLELKGDMLYTKAYLGYAQLPPTCPLSWGVVGRVARTGHFAFVTNIAADPDYVAAAEDVVAQICVPIMHEGRVLGVLSVEESHEGALNQDDLTLLTVIADQLAIAATNAALYRDALAREQFATRLGQLGMTLSSTFELFELMEILCHEAVALFAVDVAAIYLREEARGTASAAGGDEAASLVCRAAAGSRRELLLGSRVALDQLDNPVARALHLARGFIVHHAMIPNPPAAPVQPGSKHIVGASERSVSLTLQACLAVPMMKEREGIGVLLLGDLLDPQRFDESDLARATIVASQAGLAIANARLYQETQRRAQEQASLYKIGLAISSTLDIVKQLEIISDQMTRLFRTNTSYIALCEENDMLHFALFVDQGKRLEPFSVPLQKAGFAGWVVQSQQPLVIDDVRRRWDELPTKPGERERPSEIASYIGMPLLIKSQAIGVMALARASVEPFSIEEQRLLTALAQQAAIALENARLHQQTQHALEQLRLTQERLIESERRAAIGELVAGLAHEINNPLTAIIGHSQLLMEMEPQDFPAEGTSRPDVSTPADSQATRAWRAEVETISAAAQRIARIVQEFTKLSQFESVPFERVDLNQVIRQAIKQFEAHESLASHGIEIAVSQTPAPDGLLVEANPLLLYEVLDRILTNAVEAMPHGGRIDVQSGLTPDEMAFCSIRDTGPGIPAADLKRVFEPGYTTKVEAGTVRGIGLGLYTAERIIKSHGGRIWLESQEGSYTQVTFCLPRAKGVNADAKGTYPHR